MNKYISTIIKDVRSSKLSALTYLLCLAALIAAFTALAQTINAVNEHYEMLETNSQYKAYYDEIERRQKELQKFKDSDWKEFDENR